MLVEKILSEIPGVEEELISKAQLEQIKRCHAESGIAIWGAGRAGKYAVDFCRRHGIEPVCVVDNAPHERGSKFDGIPHFTAVDFYREFPNIVVLIACLYTHKIDKQLEKRGYRYLTFDTPFIDFFPSPKSYEATLLKQSAKIDDLFSTLADETSKDIFERIIKYCLTLDRTYISGLNTQNIYFDNDVIPNFSGNAFVDCGAFDGDTLLQFTESLNCDCGTYYALEPSLREFHQIESLIQKKSILNAIPIAVGAWNQKDTLYFVEGTGEGGVCGRISSEGAIAIPVDSLDHLFSDIDVDFIKMDIEGAEIPAIEGAQNIIKRCQPILAISIYHKVDDLWAIPFLIREINPDYKLYIRHHTDYRFDTVLYALP